MKLTRPTSFAWINTKWNAVCPTLTLNEQWPAAWQPGWITRGSRSFTCHPHVYPRMGWAVLHSFCKHSPDGGARAKWRTSGSAYSYYSSIDLERMKGWVGLVGWHYSGWFTNINGHPSATGRAWTVKVLRSETSLLPLCKARSILATMSKQHYRSNRQQSCLLLRQCCFDIIASVDRL